MVRKFDIARKKKYNIKTIAVLLFLVLAISIGLINEYCFDDALFNNLDDGYLVIILLFVFTLPLLLIFVAAKNYRKDGELVFDKQGIRVLKRNSDRYFKYSEIERVHFLLKGVYGKHIGGYWGLGLADSADGSGNIFKFRSMGIDHHINVVLNKEDDLRLMKRVLDEMSNKYRISVYVEKTK